MKKLNKKIIIGITVVLAVIVVSTLCYVAFKPTQPSEEGELQEPELEKFTISIEPKDITVEIGEEGVVCITIKSTGYEGEVKLSPTWTGPTYEPLYIHPVKYNSSNRFLEKNGVLALKYTFEFHVEAGETYDHQTSWTHKILVYGNYGTEREFTVVDFHTVTVLPEG